MKVVLCECVFIGDSFKNDYEASRLAGMHSIYRLNNENDTHNVNNSIKNLNEIPDLIKYANNI